MYCPNRERDLDTFLCKSNVKAFDEFVLDQILINILPCPENRREVDAALAESVVADKGLEIRNAAGNRFHESERNLRGDPFDLLKIGVIGDTDVHQHGVRLSNSKSFCSFFSVSVSA